MARRRWSSSPTWAGGRLGRRRLAADDLASSVREPAHRSLPEGDGGWPTSGASSRLRRGCPRCKDGGLDGLEIEAYGHLSTSSGRRSSTSAAIATAARSTTGCASRSRSSRRSGERRRRLHRRHPDDRRRGRPGRADRGRRRRDRATLARTGTIDFINLIKGSIATDEAISARDPRAWERRSGRHSSSPAGSASGSNLPIFHANRIADVATARYADRGGPARHGRDDAGPHGRPAHRPQARSWGERPHQGVCRGLDVHQPAVPRPRLAVHPEPGDGREGTIPSDAAIVRTTATRRGRCRRRSRRARGRLGLPWSAVIGRAAGGGGPAWRTGRAGGRATARRGDLIGDRDWLASECRHAGVEPAFRRCRRRRGGPRSQPDVVFGRPAASQDCRC